MGLAGEWVLDGRASANCLHRACSIDSGPGAVLFLWLSAHGPHERSKLNKQNRKIKAYPHWALLAGTT